MDKVRICQKFQIAPPKDVIKHFKHFILRQRHSSFDANLLVSGSLVSS